MLNGLYLQCMHSMLWQLYTLPTKDIMIYPGCIIAADGIGSIKDGGENILLDVADFGCIVA